MRTTPLMWVVLCAVGCQAMAEELAKLKEEKKLTTIRVVGTSSEVARDEIGYSRVYSRDISTVYKGKQAIETYRGSSVSDLFSGMVGVYSGDSRNSGALDPNIRGVQGQGRVPLTIDGTEQSITVWRGYAGSNNRNYVDPNLISSIYMEKGPSLDPSIKSGIGGAVAMKTLEIDDIVKNGEQYGVEIKTEIGNNAIKPLPNPYEKTVDYRTLDNPYAVTGGMWRSMFGDDGRQAQRFWGGERWGGDKAFRIAAGVKKPQYDALVAYAYRDKGNYFSGKKGGNKYSELSEHCKKVLSNADNGPKNAVTACLTNHTDPFVSYLARLYFLGGEVTNTSLNTQSWLAKFNYRPSDAQSIAVGARMTHTRFGEIMPSRIGVGQATFGTVLQWPESWVKQQAFNLDYKLNPKDKPWLNLDASLWTTRTHSRTNSAGGAPGDVRYFDNTAGWDFEGGDPDEHYKKFLEVMGGINGLAAMVGLTPDANDPDFEHKLRCAASKMLGGQRFGPKSGCLDNVDGRFNTIDGAAYYANNNRIGFKLSNTMKLAKRLELTLMGDIQYETLRATNNFADFLKNPEHTFSDGLTATRSNSNRENILYNSQLDNIAMPRNGTRSEYSLGFNFKYSPTDWLTFNAGARYSGYWVKDDYIKQYLNEGPLRNEKSFSIDGGKEYLFYTQMTPEEEAIYNYSFDRHARYVECADKFGLKHDLEGRTEEELKKWQDCYHEATGRIWRYAEDKGSKFIGNWLEDPERMWYTVLEWHRDEYGRLRREADPSTSLLSKLDETTVNLQGETVPKYKLEKGRLWLVKTISREELMKAASKKSGQGWAPQFSLSIQTSDNGRLYGRYVEHLRWPSIFEATVGFGTRSSTGVSYTPGLERLYYKFKPEHAKNWEVGYVHDLSGLIPQARYADVRINYYHNTTENVMDRNSDYTIVQFDKRIKTGVELQGRVDFGRFFADVGVVRTLKTQVCDADYVDAEMSAERKKNAPSCFNGGFFMEGYLTHAIQPRWSVTANLGTRWLNNQLELGSRFTYHSRVKDTYARTVLSYQPNYRTLQIDSWQPVFLIDAYARYQISKNISAEMSATNITDQYYQDPMTRSMMPGPGRTIRLSIKGTF